MNKHLLTAALVSTLAGSALSAPYVEIPGGQKVYGQKLEAQEDGVIILYVQGQPTRYPKGTKAVPDRPEAIDQALELLEKKDYTRAASLLEKIVAHFRLLTWDVYGRRLLARAYVGMEDYERAARLYETVLKDFPDLLQSPDERGDYLQALLGVKDVERLKPLLDETIADSERTVAAEAQIMRGNLLFGAGRTEEALYDFMRTAEFFRDVPDTLPEATFRTAECLEKMGDPRAKEFYQRVVDDFPSSTFATRARSRI